MPGKKRAAASETSSDTTSSSESSESCYESSSESCTSKEKKIAKITADLIPKKSAEKYRATWDAFMKDSKVKGCPKEPDFILYIDRLVNHRKLSYKTLWTTFSMLKKMAAITFPEEAAKEYPQVTAMLKKLEGESNAPKKASTFSKEDVERFLGLGPQDTTNLCEELLLQLQAFLLCGFYGGLRLAELYELKRDDISWDPDYGHWVRYLPKKARGAAEYSCFLVPLSAAEKLTLYLSSLPQQGGRLTGLWFGINWNQRRKTGNGCKTAAGFKKARLGINTMRNFTIKIATELKLPHPTKFTSHSLRRSAATTLADNSASLPELMKFFGWTSTTVAQGYIDRSKSLLLRMANGLTGSAPLTSGPTPSVPGPEVVPSSDPTGPLLPAMAAIANPQPLQVTYHFSIKNVSENATVVIGSDLIGKHTKTDQ